MIVSIVVDLCSYRMSTINRVEERRDGSLVRWQANQRNAVKCPPGPPPPPAMGKFPPIGRTLVAVLEEKQKAGNVGGGAL